MADIAMCNGADCPIKNKCHRHTAGANPHGQTMADFVYRGGECKDYWNNKGYAKYDQKGRRIKEL